MGKRSGSSSTKRKPPASIQDLRNTLNAVSARYNSVVGKSDGETTQNLSDHLEKAAEKVKGEQKGYGNVLYVAKTHPSAINADNKAINDTEMVGKSTKDDTEAFSCRSVHKDSLFSFNTIRSESLRGTFTSTTDILIQEEGENLPTSDITDREEHEEANEVPSPKASDDLQIQSNRISQARRGTLIGSDMSKDGNLKGESEGNWDSTARENPSSSIKGKGICADGPSDSDRDLNEDYELGFDELEQIDDVDEFIAYENESGGHDRSNLRFSYEELTRETELLQKRCMELDQENYAMRRDIKAGALISPDLRKADVGSTPYYPNRGRGQGIRGHSSRGRQTYQGYIPKSQRPWSLDSKKVGGINNSTQHWRPQTPPVDTKQREIPHDMPNGTGTHLPVASFEPAVSNSNPLMWKVEDGDKPPESVLVNHSRPIVGGVQGNVQSSPAGNINANPSMQNTSKIAWADLLRSNKNTSFPLKFYKPKESSKRGCVDMPLDVTLNGSKKWESTLMGYFIDKKLPYSLVSKAAYRFWGKVGLNEVLATESGYYFFKFATIDQKVVVLEGGPWHVASQPMILRDWEPGVVLSKDAQSTVPIWCNILSVPLEYQSPEGISRIASAIGRPLHVDRITAGGTRITFARVCVELDAETEPLKEIQVNVIDPLTGDSKSIFLNIVYQWLPSRCPKCRVFGHNCEVKPKAPIATVHKPKAGNDTWKIIKRGKEVVEVDPAPKTHDANTEMVENLNIEVAVEAAPATSKPVNNQSNTDIAPAGANANGVSALDGDIPHDYAIINEGQIAKKVSPANVTVVANDNDAITAVTSTANDVTYIKADTVTATVPNAGRGDVTTAAISADVHNTDNIIHTNEQLYDNQGVPSTTRSELLCRINKGSQIVMTIDPKQTPPFVREGIQNSNKFATLSTVDESVVGDCVSAILTSESPTTNNKGLNREKKGKSTGSTGKGAGRN